MTNNCNNSAAVGGSMLCATRLSIVVARLPATMAQEAVRIILPWRVGDRMFNDSASTALIVQHRKGGKKYVY